VLTQPAGLTADITAAALSITADDKSKMAGTANPVFTATASGFQGTETFSDLAGMLVFYTPATTTSPAGSYFIAPSGLTSGNYSISFVDGALTITPPVITTPPVVNPAGKEIKNPNAAAHAAAGLANANSRGNRR
jgi:hypothetical protein